MRKNREINVGERKRETKMKKEKRKRKKRGRCERGRENLRLKKRRQAWV